LERSLHQRIEWLSAVNKIHQTNTGEASLAVVYQELSADSAIAGATLVFILRWHDQSDGSDIFAHPSMRVTLI
jgi:hypothetical protein